MTDALIEKTSERGVLWLTLNNADQRNPLSSTMLAEILHHWRPRMTTTRYAALS